MQISVGGVWLTVPVKITPEQTELLEQFVKENSEVEDRRFAVTHKEAYNALWEEIAEKLNEIGPPAKSAHNWKKTWISRKHKKNLKRRLEGEKTPGNTSSIEANLSESSQEPEYNNAEDSVQPSTSSTTNEDLYFEACEIKPNVDELANGKRKRTISHRRREPHSLTQEPSSSTKRLSQSSIEEEERESSPEASFYIPAGKFPTVAGNRWSISNASLHQSILEVLKEQKHQLQDISSELKELRMLKAEEVRLKSQEISLLREKIELMKKNKRRK